MSETKSFQIPKQLVMDAYKRVQANGGAAGVDQQSLSDFAVNLKDNLYKIWNRMSSGTYFPPPVMAVSIPKKAGGERVLGIPTVSDRVAQMVVKQILEPELEPHFLPDSYGYRPGKSALDAVGITRRRCWRYEWVLEFDIRGLFDNIPHDLLLKALEKHTSNPWVLLYIKRWLKASMKRPDGELEERTCGTPQGGVVSPLLANLFLHYAFDKWMQCHHAEVPWCRYADDGLLHCRSEAEAQGFLLELAQRFKECGLELHPEKTKIVYCKDDNRRKEHEKTSFDFLGFTYRPRRAVNSKGVAFVSFSPAVSKSAAKSMRAKIRRSGFRNWSEVDLNDIARKWNPVLSGWLNYYGEYYVSTLYSSVLRHFNESLAAWAMHKYKRLKRRKRRAYGFLNGVAQREPNLFAHWRRGGRNVLA